MRIKIGDTWYEARSDQSIMVELEPQDRANISAMPPDNRLYAIFDEGDPRPLSCRIDWMLAGASGKAGL